MEVVGDFFDKKNKNIFDDLASVFASTESVWLTLLGVSRFLRAVGREQRSSMQFEHQRILIDLIVENISDWSSAGKQCQLTCVQEEKS